MKIHFTLVVIIIALMSISAECNEQDWINVKQEIKDHISSGLIQNETNESTDNTTKDNLTTLLSSYTFTHVYEENVFDCSDMSQITYQILKENGYTPKIIYKADQRDESPTQAHLYLSIKGNDGGDIMIETIKNPNNIIGTVKTSKATYPYYNGWYVSFNNTKELNQWPPFAGGGIVNDGNINKQRHELTLRVR
jgi:hypothetical protein